MSQVTISNLIPREVPNYFIVSDGVGERNITIKIVDEGRKSIAKEILAGNIPELHLKANIIKRTASYNQGWSFHLDPYSIEFFSTGPDYCNASFSNIQERFDQVGNTFLSNLVLCPKKSLLIAETEVYVPEYLPPQDLWYANISIQPLLENNKFYHRNTDFQGNYALISGNLPNGLSLTISGNITGTVNIVDPSVTTLISDFEYTVEIENNGETYQRKYITTVVNTQPYYRYSSLDSVYNLYTGYQYIFKVGSVITYPDTKWRVVRGNLPPNATFSINGELIVNFGESIRPFVLDQFINIKGAGVATLEPEYWQEYLARFFSDTHELDYQFTVELFHIYENITITAHTVRITHLKTPWWSEWFRVNQDYLQLDPNQYYYYVSTSETENVVWNTSPGLLGHLYNGQISQLAVSASADNGESVLINFKPNSYGNFPQGLQLQPDGIISGRVSFRCYEDDPVNLPLNDIYSFVLRAYSKDFDSYAERLFTIKVEKVNPKPCDNIWISAYPYIKQRLRFKEIMDDQSIFPDELIYRPSDPWFGKANKIKILFAPGLNITSPATYETILQSNHYNKTLYFDTVKTAVSLDQNLSIEYEVVYLTLIDELVSLYQIESFYPRPITRTLDLRGYISNYYLNNGLAFYVLKPNSLDAMQLVLTESVGLLNKGLVPNWMVSPQPIVDKPGQFNSPIGFKPVVVLAYCKPGGSKQIARALSSINFNEISFEFDRYQLESRLSDNYDLEMDQYETAEFTIFDNNQLEFDNSITKFIENIEHYADPEVGDKYLKFPKLRVFK